MTLLVTYTDVIREAGKLFKVDPRDIMGKYKYDFILPARFAVFKALHLRGNSYAQVGRWMGRDHSTVRNGVMRATEWMKVDTDYETKIILLAGSNRQQPRKGGR